MAGLIGKLAAYARTPAGQRAIRTAAARAQEVARDPKTRARVDELRQRAAQRRARGGPGDPGAGPR